MCWYEWVAYVSTGCIISAGELLPCQKADGPHMLRGAVNMNMDDGSNALQLLKVISVRSSVNKR